MPFSVRNSTAPGPGWIRDFRHRLVGSADECAACAGLRVDCRLGLGVTVHRASPCRFAGGAPTVRGGVGTRACVLAAGGLRPPLIASRIVPYHTLSSGWTSSWFYLKGSPCHFTSATTWASSGQSCVGKPLLVRVVADEQPAGFGVVHHALHDEFVADPDHEDLSVAPGFPVCLRWRGVPGRFRWIFRLRTPAFRVLAALRTCPRCPSWFSGSRGFRSGTAMARWGAVVRRAR